MLLLSVMWRCVTLSQCRYVPRIESGRDYWESELRKAVVAQDWTTLKEVATKRPVICTVLAYA